jgi:hypothetical protein
MHSSPSNPCANRQDHLNGNQHDLSALALQIRNALRAFQVGMSNALDAALDAGDALIAAQEQVAKGQWTRWLKENCFLRKSTALLYMQLARHRDEVEAELTRVGELSLRAARRLVTKPDKPSEPKPKKQSTPLIDAWRAASAADHSALFDVIPLEEFLRAFSIPLRRKLEARLRKQAPAWNEADSTLSLALRTALSYAAHEDGSGDKLALNALRGILRKHPDFHELIVGIEKAEPRRRAA